MAWLRLDDRFTKHPKFDGWTASEKWAWLEVMEYCAAYKTGGSLPKDLSIMPRSTTKSLLKKAQDSGWIDQDEDGSLSVHDWDVYNPKDPLKADRQARWRAKRNGHVDADVDALVDGAVDESVDGSIVYPHARASARVPVPSPTPTPSTQPAAQRQPEDPDPDAAAEAIGLNRVAERLAAAGWTDEQIRQASGRPGGWPRAVAWLDHAENDASCREPGALAWTKFLTGTEPPEQQATLAAGAQGTRSAKPRGHECPHCGVVKAGPASLQEHIENVHWEIAA